MTSVRMTYLMPRVTGLPSCSRLAMFDCGKHRAEPATGFTECRNSCTPASASVASELLAQDGLRGMKNVVLPPSKSSLR
eukprot:scaffold6230_cov127-Isochrysis_galbana.AAC.13